MTPFGERLVTASPAPLVAAPRPTGTSTADVSFVMVTYGTGPIVIDALASLIASLEAADVVYEIIVVDHPHPARPSGSIGSTRSDLLLCTSGVVLVSPDRNLGFGGGCELGALHATAPVLAFVNPDTEFAPGWLQPLLQLLAESNDDGPPVIVAPTLVNPGGSIQEVGQTLFADGHTTPNLHRGVVGGAADVDYASAACWLMRRDDHEQTGGFDPAYHPAYFEDVDLALRIRSHGGHTVVHQDVAVTHRRGSGTAEAPIPATHQRATLLATWPEIRWRQPHPRHRPSV